MHHSILKLYQQLSIKTHFMKKIALLILFAVLFNNLALAQSPASAPLLLHFDTDKANISAEASGALENALAGLNGGPEKYRVEITAHTDLRGSLAYNQDLSKRRGEAVAAFLKNKGFIAENISIQAEGETKPLAKDETDVALAENRRVEVRFIRDAGALSSVNNKVPVAKLKFQAEKGIKFESPRTGTQINIPAGILAKQDGTPVTGQVDLQFREYRNFGDFIASGLPMHYNDSQGEFFFNSGGMFEVRTFQNGEELTIIPGNSYTVNFTPTADLTNPNLFLFDNESQQWNYVSSASFASPIGIGDASAPVETPQAVFVSETDVIRNNTAGNGTPCMLPFIPFPLNSDTLEMMQKSLQTGLAIAEGRDKVEPWFRKFVKRSDAFFLGSLERSTIELVGSFSSEFFPDDKTGVFTELQAFKDHYFESDSVDRTSIANLLNGGPLATSTNSKSKVFKSLIVEYEGNGKCLLTLNDGETDIQVHAILRMSTELISRSNHNDADEVMDRYKKLRQERQGVIIEKIDRWRKFLLFAPLFQTTEESCMSQQQWMDYFDKNLPLMRKRYEDLIAKGMGSDMAMVRAALKSYGEIRQKASQAIYQRNAALYEKSNVLSRELRLSKFGTYNCDQIFRLSQKPEFITADFQAPDGSTIKPLIVNIIDRDTRMFFNGVAQGKMYKLPGRKMDIVVTDTDGRMFYLSANDYSKLNFDQQQTFTFNMNDVTDKVSTPKEWMAILGI